MTKTRSTKTALLSSVLALFLCITMLLGTTFAWFTDSVTSANNIITAGNLDIELEYWDGDSWEDVAGKSDILTNTLYEPGVTEVAYLRVANAGTLALKYQLGINIVSETEGTNMAGDPFKLSDHIMFGVVEGINGETGAYADRDNAIAAVTNAQKISAGYTKADELVAGAAPVYLALVVYMPTSVGNEANHNGTNVPSINLGINVFATQLAYEEDSFDEKYDEPAPMKPADTWDGSVDTDISTEKNETEKLLTISTAEEFAAFAAEVNAGNNYQGWTIELAANIDLANKPWTPIGNSSNGFYGTFDGKEHIVYNLNASGTTNVGLFGYALNGGNIKNLYIENATLSGDDYVGAVLGRGYTDIVNCHVKNATVTVTPYLKDDGVTYDGGAKAGAVIGQILEGSGNGIEGCTATNVYIKGYRDLGGVVGMIHSNNYAKNCSADGVTIEYMVLFGAYDSNTPNENAGAVYGRKNSTATIEGISDEENADFKLVTAVHVSTADELVAAFANLKAGYTLVLENSIDMTGKTITPVTGNKGFTMLGNGYTISNLDGTEQALFVSHSGSASYTFDGVVLENCDVVSSTNYGALFVGDGDTSDAITIKNCVVKNCTVNSAKYAAAFVGYTAGYNVVNNGPVYSDVLIENCSVIGGSITGGGSTGAAIGHSGGNVDTTTKIVDFVVDGVAINGEDAAHTGVVVGTANVGDTVITNATYSNVTGNYNTTTVLYGRFVPGETGTLVIDGVQK